MNNINSLARLGCSIVGWNPAILRSCTEASFAMLKRYMAAIIIMSLIWGTIGWCVAGNYLGLTHWYEKLLTLVVFVAVIVCIERFIIHTHGMLKSAMIFRTVLALTMAILGATVFDQTVFKDDIDREKEDINMEDVNKVLPKKVQYIDEQLGTVAHMVDSINSVQNKLSEEIRKNPVIRTTLLSSNVQTAADGNVERRHSSNQVQTPNPAISQFNSNVELLKEYIGRQNELNENRRTAKEDLEKYYKEHGGFLTDLKALGVLLGRENIALVFYIVMFVFLTCLELLVITTKGGYKCDYDGRVHYALKQAEERMQ